MPETPVDRLHADFSDISKLLLKVGDLSLLTTAEENFRKALLIAAWSYIEDRIKEVLRSFFSEVSDPKLLVVSFIANTTLDRNIYSLFEFNDDTHNVNSLFGKFGSEFKSYVDNQRRQLTGFSEAEKGFVELGRSRNYLVHRNYVSFPLDKTTDEIYDLYRLAHGFVELVDSKLHEFTQAVK